MNNLFNEKYSYWKSIVEQELDRLIPVRNTPEATIYQSMRYSLLAGGKRIRPVLALAVSELLGVNQKEILPFACALEMIHTYSLIHDDLPAMDNDDLRRGMKTNHIVYGEDIAILAGDGLLNKAFEVMASAIVKMPDKDAGSRMMNEVAKCSGVHGMVGGQVVDLESEGKSISLDTLLYMHSMKTGALIKAACTIPTLYLGDETETSYTHFSSFAHFIGIAFQIKDDILDVQGDSKVLGKSVGKDREQMKTTFLTFYDVNKCEELLKDYTSKALQILDYYGDNADFLRKMCDYLLKRRN